MADRSGSSLLAALVGRGVGSRASEVIACGADKVFIGEDDLLGEYQADVYLAAAEKICRKSEASLMIFAGDAFGREMAPRLAHRLDAGLATDCVELRAASGLPVFVRPVYGGKALAAVQAEGRPLVATVRLRAMDPAARDGSRRGEVVTVSLRLDPALKRTRVLEVIQEKSEGPKLDDARAIVSGGRGVGSPENFRVLKELAQVLGGAVGASRAAVDAGWVPSSIQIGQTGKIVGPDLYFAVGISGASQHLAGISAAKCVVAINTDSEAPIFKAAKVGVVADYRKVVPALTRKLQEVLKG